MKKHLWLAFTVATLTASAQQFVSEKSSITFFSDAAVEDIAATNARAASLFNQESGAIAFDIPIKAFDFAKSKMKDHFNEKYMETEKFPSSTFQGIVSGFQPGTPGPQNAKAKGKLTIHGVTKEVEIPGTIEFKDNKIFIKTKFMVKLEDYNITRPQLLWQNIAEQVEVTADFTYKQDLTYKPK